MNYFINIRLISFILMGILLIFQGSCEKGEVDDISVTDVDGNVYRIVKIGTQTWMAENLKTTKYRSGEPIGTTDPHTLDIRGEDSVKYQWAYNGNEVNVSTYGRLYTWYAIKDKRGVCPVGYHVPSREEWAKLSEFIGGASSGGGGLKERGTEHWLEPNFGATDTTGFTALPGGYRGYNGEFFFLGHSGIWWSSTESDHLEGSSWIRSLNRYSPSFYLTFTLNTVSAYSVRCIKD
jgi:uncharacterized protein (TIGR02145 family)